MFAEISSELVIRFSTKMGYASDVRWVRMRGDEGGGEDFNTRWTRGRRGSLQRLGAVSGLARVRKSFLKLG